MHQLAHYKNSDGGSIKPTWLTACATQILRIIIEEVIVIAHVDWWELVEVIIVPTIRRKAGLIVLGMQQQFIHEVCAFSFLGLSWMHLQLPIIYEHDKEFGKRFTSTK